MKNIWLTNIAYAALLLTACAKAPGSDISGSGQVEIDFSASAQTIDITRAALTAPQASEFALSITKSDNTLNQKWDNILLYPAETRLPTGEYTATASYGDANIEDFEAPCFMASKRFEILTDKTTRVELTATLANTAVNVSFTDAFKSYFGTYAAALTKNSGREFAFAPDETRTLYISPADFTVKATYTKPNGKQGQATVPCTGVKARQRYDIVFDVNGGQVGDAAIKVTLNDEVLTQNVFIDIFETENE